MNKFKNNMNLLDTQTLLYPRAVETTPIAYRHVIRINREIGEPSIVTGKQIGRAHV